MCVECYDTQSWKEEQIKSEKTLASKSIIAVFYYNAASSILRLKRWKMIGNCHKRGENGAPKGCFEFLLVSHLLTYRGWMLSEADVYALDSCPEPLKDGKQSHVADSKVDEEHGGDLVIGRLACSS